MKWKKTNGQIMDAQDNFETEKYLTSLGFTKIGSPPVEIGEPEQETVEISEADIPDNLPMSDPTPNTPAVPPPPGPEQEEQSISPDEVGEMPKDILGG